MGRQTWITRDGQGNVVSSTEVRTSSGCSGCLWLVLGLFVVVAPAAWAANGTIPIAVAVLMYVIEAAIAVAAVVERSRRRASH